jgi:hypothetical protein
MMVPSFSKPSNVVSMAFMKAVSLKRRRNAKMVSCTATGTMYAMLSVTVAGLKHHGVANQASWTLELASCNLLQLLAHCEDDLLLKQAQRARLVRIDHALQRPLVHDHGAVLARLEVTDHLRLPVCTPPHP